MQGTISKDLWVSVRRTIIIAAVVGILYHLAFAKLPVKLQTPLFDYILGYFVVFGIFIHYLLLKLSALKPKQFITYFMGMTGLKLFVNIIFIMIYLGLSEDKSRIAFIVNFFILYLIFSFSDISGLLRTLGGKKTE